MIRNGISANVLAAGQPPDIKVHVATVVLMVLALLNYPSPSIAAQSTVHECDRLTSIDADMKRVAPPVPLGRVDKARALAACAEALAQEPENPRFLTQYGYLLVLDGRPSEGREFVRRAAEKNYAAAEYLLGVWLEDKTFSGNGLPEPMTFFNRSAAHGNPYAMYHLALAAVRRPGRDRDKAVRWAREAAANGLPNAESNVAFIILSFPSEGKETELALSTVEKEIEAGNLDVMFNEAVRTWSHSPLVPVPGFGRANERAYRLMKTAAEKGYLPARNFLGIPNK